MDASVTSDAALLAERLGKRLAKHDAAVLDRMVEINVEVALGAEFDIDQGVARQLLEHVVEKADAGRNVVGSGPVEVEARRDPRFLGLPVNRRDPGR
jgi:hypothetical protein